MPKSIVNSDSLKRFSSDLKNYEGEIQQIVSSIERELNSFRWSDPQGARFHSNFDYWKREVESSLLPLLRKSHEHIDKLAMRIDEYNE